MRPEDTTLCETKPTGEELSRRFPRVRQLFEALLRHSKNLDEADWDMPEEDYKSMAAAIDEVFPQSPGPERADMEAFAEDERRAAVKALAYTIDPECWVSYSGKPKPFKVAMDIRRTAALNEADARIATSERS